MDWTFAIERHRGPLLLLVTELFGRIGLTEEGSVERISKPLHRFVLSLLRPAESAVRRLIIAAASNIVVEPRERRPSKPRPKSSNRDKAVGEAKPMRKRRPLFSLFDPLKRFARRFKKKIRRIEPRIRVLGDPPDPRHRMFRELGRPQTPPAPPAPVVEEEVPVDDGMVSAKHLIRRLIAILDALQDIPRHARRYALWRDQPPEERHPERRSALRVGRPPGFRQRPIHEVDEILKECHWLALKAEHPLDTS